MTQQEINRMDYALTIGNAERITGEVQETLNNLEDLTLILREDLDRAAIKQTEWIGAFDLYRNIASLLSHELDELQNEISKSKAAVSKLLKEGEANADTEV